MKKYKLTDETIELNGHVLHRIVAQKQINNTWGIVDKGDKGGFVESEDNLSDEGTAWVFGQACVYDNAKVSYGASVGGRAQIFGNAKIYGECQIAGFAEVYGNAIVWDNAYICGDVRICGNARIEDYAEIIGGAFIHDNATVCDYVQVCGHADIGGSARVYGLSHINGEARIGGTACISSGAEITKDAVIEESNDYMVFRNNFSSYRNFTWTRSNNKWKIGCFYGTDEELRCRAAEDDKKNPEYHRALFYGAYIDFKNHLLELEKLCNIKPEVSPVQKQCNNDK